MNNKFILGLTLSVSLFVFSAGSACAGDFIFVRPGDPDRIFKQDEALVIQLPENLSSDEMGSLFLELDGIDVTQMVTLEDTRAIFYPATPYGGGTHTLRLVRLGRTGKLMELNRWNFTVAGGVPPVTQDASVNGNVDATYNYMAWDNYDSADRPERHNLSAQGQVAAATQAQSWQLSLRGNGFLNSEDEFNPGQDNIEVGEYLLRAENATNLLSTAFSLGSHQINADNLLIEEFYRRGASARFDVMQDRAQITAFLMNPEAAFGNSNFTGIQQSAHLVRGIHLYGKPSLMLDDKLELEGSVYDGSGNDGGSGTSSSFTDQSDGNGYQVGLKSALIRDYLGFRTQFAHSDFDVDGHDTGLAGDKDDAVRASFAFTPLGGEVSGDGTIRSWTIETAYQKTGNAFQSLMNSFLESDRETVSIGSSYYSGSFSLDGEVAWLRDNVHDDPTITRDGMIQGWVNGSYAPETVLPGTPVFVFGAIYSDEDRLKTPVSLFPVPDLDRTTYSLNGGVTLSFEKTSFSINHTFNTLHDRADTLTDYHSHFTDLGVQYTPNERISLNSGLQFEKLQEDIDGNSTAVHWNIGGNFILIPDKFWNDTSYSMLINEGRTPAGHEFNAETEFTWLLKAPETNTPGYAVSLAGLYDNIKDTEDDTDEEDEDARVFVRLKISMPFSY